MLNFLSKLNPWILVSLGGVVIFIMILLKNIFSGAFNVTKFFGGFNLLAVGVQGKLIYYFIIFTVFAILAYGLYHKLTEATNDFTNNYRNNVHDNQQVTLDQKQIINTDVSCFGISLGHSCLGFATPSVPKVETTTQNKVSNNTLTGAKTEITTKPIKPLVKKAKSNIFSFTWKVVSFPVKTIFNIAKKTIKKVL